MDKKIMLPMKKAFLWGFMPQFLRQKMTNPFVGSLKMWLESLRTALTMQGQLLSISLRFNNVGFPQRADNCCFPSF
jgi:hypothetical protein